LILVGLALVVGLCGAGCFQTRYLTQQGIGQLRLLRARRKIDKVLTDPAVDQETKRRLKLALEARRFGIEVLGLRGGDSYTRFLDTGGAPVAYNLSAAPPDKLVPHIYRFPLVGQVPYLGFFHEKDAKRQEEALRRRGFDTYLRPVAGYSTLGITSDPIYSSMLDGGDERIVEVVLHEMLHGTLYIAGHSDFNESIATFVGVRGAALFFARHGSSQLGQTVIEEAQKRQEEQERFARFLEPVMRELEALYERPISREEKLAEREAVFKRAQARFLEIFPPPPGHRPSAFATRPLNNAILISYGVYHRDTPLHERLYERTGRDLTALIRLYKDAAENHTDPVKYLERL
jgi:predicted aminopeptidase